MSRRAFRTVTDILSVDGAPVAFIQLHPRDVLSYQGVCPWCAKNIGSTFEALTFGELYAKLYDLTAEHVRGSSCAFATKMKVEIRRERSS